MDKEKLIEYIDGMSHSKVNPNRSVTRVVSSDTLIEMIKSGTFDKEPCEYCSEDEDRDYYLGEKYCSNCGRKLEDTNHDNWHQAW